MTDRLTDSDLEALLYHGCSSGTSTPAFVRDKIVKAAQELQERRAHDRAANKVGLPYESFRDGPITDAQLDGMLRWGEDKDLPIYAQVIGPRAARELRVTRDAKPLSGEDLEVLRHYCKLEGHTLCAYCVKARDVLDRIASGKTHV